MRRTLTVMQSLYAAKPWYAARLAGVRRLLVSHRVSPGAITVVGVGFGGLAGLTLTTVTPGLLCGLAVAGLLAARLACTNLDGGVARESGRETRVGAVVNELGDRGAELAALAGCLALAPAGLVAGAALAATAPSWVSLAGAAGGGPRLQGGPVGKTERCLLLVAIAATGSAMPLLAVFAAGSLFTAALRLRRLWTVLS